MDASQFKSTFLPYYQKLYTVAWRLTGNAQSAEDLVQETFLKLWTRRGQILINKNAGAYAITLLRNVYYDTLRSRKIEETEADIGQMRLTAGEDPARQIEAHDEYARLRCLIAGLPDPQGRIMAMRDLEGLPYNEISRETGLTEVNIRSILSRARRRIRELLKETKT